MEPQGRGRGKVAPGKMSRERAITLLDLSLVTEEGETVRLTKFTEEDIQKSFRRQSLKLEERGGKGRLARLVETHEAYQVLVQQLRLRKAPTLTNTRRAGAGNIFQDLQTVSNMFGCGNEPEHCTC